MNFKWRYKKPTLTYPVFTDLGEDFPTLSGAAKEVGHVTMTSHIKDVLDNPRRTCKGRRWFRTREGRDRYIAQTRKDKDEHRTSQKPV